MPTFFTAETLTPEQQARWDAAMATYAQVMANNAAKFGEPVLSLSQAGHPKSALFWRLLEGKDPLPAPPPLSYSYPWYSVVEDAGPWTVVAPGEHTNTVTDFINSHYLLDGAPQVIIHQSAWELVKKVSDTELRVTHRNWKAQGYWWRLVLEQKNTKDTGQFIVAWHDRSLGRITTLEQLVKEQRWHVDQEVLALELALSDREAEPDEASAMPLGLSSKTATSKARGLRFLAARRAAGKSDIPDAHEVEALAAEGVARTLERGYSVNDQGELMLAVWQLYRGG